MLPPASKTFFNLLEVMQFFDLLEVIQSSQSDSYLLPLLLQLEGTTIIPAGHITMSELIFVQL